MTVDLDGAAGLSPAEAIGFASAHGLVTAGQAAAAALGGGVSNDTVMVSDGARRVVVKRALERLRTEVDWHASAARALDEADALRLVATITPDRVPPVLAVDTTTATIALAAAPEDWRDWKVELLGGTVRPEVGATLGATLGAWHAGTHARPELVAALDGMDRMESLRLAPFHGILAARHADLAGLIGAAAAQLREQRLCFVHGDFSPKNVLAGDTDLWVIDFEVAHRGHPVFDVAFLETHLLLKALAAPARAAVLRSTADAFLAAYRATLDGVNAAARPDTPGADVEAGAGVGPIADADPAGRPSGPRLDVGAVVGELGLHTGCLVLARVDGTSLVDYLDEAAAVRARDLGRRLIIGAITLPEVWAEVTGG